MDLLSIGLATLKDLHESMNLLYPWLHHFASGWNRLFSLYLHLSSLSTLTHTLITILDRKKLVYIIMLLTMKLFYCGISLMILQQQHYIERLLLLFWSVFKVFRSNSFYCNRRDELALWTPDITNYRVWKCQVVELTPPCYVSSLNRF